MFFKKKKRHNKLSLQILSHMTVKELLYNTVSKIADFISALNLCSAINGQYLTLSLGELHP